MDKRLDASMPLPVDADGVPIHFGDTVFTNNDPVTSWGVRYIELRRDMEPIIGIESSGLNTYMPPSCLTHERPDSKRSRIPRKLDNGPFQDWLEYEDDACALVHMGDAVDVYPDMLQGDKASGRIISVEYEPCGNLSMLLLSDIRTDERWVDYPGAIYHHREES